MSIKLYNTLSRRKEIFKPRKAGKINLFVCGPTVYDFPHIGHAKTYIFFDIFSKYLRKRGFDVFYLQNITDMDDKIIKRAGEKNITPENLARGFEKEYFKDIKSLKINGVTKYARATAHIKEIINQVQRLLKKGYAYQIEDGIYYDIKKFKEYGKLSRRTALQAEDGISRIDETKEKRNKGDFCLWKFSKANEPKWPSPWGVGRPGWHIEDTAITEKYFGSQYDIHGGGRDLMFPHHEAEIAQMEAVSGKKPLVKYWVHTGFLTVKGEKMSKSLGNFITIQDFLKENNGRVLRFFFAKNHYRSPINYTEKNVYQAKKELEKIDEFIGKLKTKSLKRKTIGQNLKLNEFKKKFYEAMDDDFNSPKAVAVIFKLVNKSNQLLDKNNLDITEAKNIINFFKEIDNFFGFIFWPEKKEKIPLELLSLAKQREEYRKKGLWQKADEIRKKIQEMGYKIEDTKEGPIIRKINY